MRNKPVIPNKRAELDIDAAFEYYLTEAGASVAIDFVNGLEKAIQHISNNPLIGSPRYAYELGLPGLRSWPLRKFPYLIFYVDLEQYVEVWRVLHSHADIPKWIRDA